MIFYQFTWLPTVTLITFFAIATLAPLAERSDRSLVARQETQSADESLYTGRTNISIKNETSEMVWVSLHFSPAQHHDGWVTRGSYQISPGQQLRVATISNHEFYLHAKSNHHDWEGTLQQATDGSLRGFLQLRINEPTTDYVVILCEEIEVVQSLASSKQLAPSEAIRIEASN